MFQLPFTAMLPQSNWVAPNVADLPVWDNAQRVAVDIECKDPQLNDLGTGVRRDGEMIGVSFAFEDGPGFYMPFGHVGEGNLDREKCLQYLRDQAKRFKGIIVGANLGYDLDYLAENGVKFHPKMFRDVQVAEPILNEHRMKYSLDTLAQIYNLPGKEETLLRQAADIFQVHPKKELWKLPAKYVGGYAEQDAHLPLRILRKQERLLEDQDLWDIYDLESRLIIVLLKMTRRGLLVDVDRLDQVIAHLEKMMEQMCGEINRRANVRLAPSDVLNTNAVAPLLEDLGFNVPYKVTTKGKRKWSVTNDWLAEVDHPVAELLRQARKFRKMQTTYCNPMYKYLTPQNRVHSTFNQLKKDKDDGKGTKGALSGRISSDNPNEQNQPIRHPTLGAVWRGIYRPDYGEWASDDYSQQEPRLTIHYAELINLQGAKEAADKYRNNPLADSHEVMAELTGLPRKAAKEIFLGLCYGMGGPKLCHKLGLPTEIRKRKGRFKEVAGPEGQRLINRFNETVPFVMQLADRVEMKAKNKGVITTLLGRAIHFPKDQWGNFDWTHKALNRLIQGGSADQMKKAMLLADEAGVRIQLQVHDELDFSARSREEAEHLADIMRGAVELRVPSKVDVEIGPSWGEINEEGRALCKEFYK